jgi:hypothetical protein
MFDQISPKLPEAPDILAPVDSLKETVIPLITPTSTPTVSVPSSMVPASSLPGTENKKFLDPDIRKDKRKEPKIILSDSKRPVAIWKIFSLVMVGLLILIFAAIFAYFLFVRSTKKTIQVPSLFPQEVLQEESLETPTPLFETPSQIPTPEIPQPTNQPNPLDTDQDGLSDEKEKTLGTSMIKADTDDDSLFDREEVEVYKTNPLDPDTDKDGYHDGDEVKNGYNPNGSGKLFDLPPSS